MIVERADASVVTADDSTVDHDAMRHEAFENLDLLYTVARLITGSRRTAVDVLPTVMVSAYRQWYQRPVETRPLVWMLGLLVEHLRRLGVASHAPSLAAAATTSPHAPGTEPSPFVVRQAILGMRADHREVLALSDVAGLTYREVGTVLHIQRAEVQGRLYRARAELRSTLNFQLPGVSSSTGFRHKIAGMPTQISDEVPTS